MRIDAVFRRRMVIAALLYGKPRTIISANMAVGFMRLNQTESADTGKARHVAHASPTHLVFVTKCRHDTSGGAQ